MSFIKKKVHEYYYEHDYNCARTTMLVLSELFNIKIEEQTWNAAIGLFGGGGFRDDDPPHLCENLSCSTIEFTYNYVLKNLE